MTANPTIVARAIESSDAYDEQFHALVTAGWAVEKSYWQLVTTDAIEALQVFRPTFDAADDDDGFVSVEVSPECAHETGATIGAARDLHDRIREPNLMVKIPATAEGVPAIEAMIGEGRSINVTLLFSLGRYAEVLEAYLAGLEAFARRGGDLATVHSVASLFVSRVDAEVDRRLDALDTPDSSAQSLRGGAGVAQAKLAYRLSREAHSGQRWNRLAQRGARVQRPLWASTSTKNPRYADTLYVDNLIGPKSINTLSESTMAAFEDHGNADVAHAEEVMDALAAAGVDMGDVDLTLEVGGIDAFVTSYRHVLGALRARRRGSPAAERTEGTGGLEVARDHWADGAAIVGDGQGWSFNWAGRDVGPQIRPHRPGRTRRRSVRPGLRGDTYVHEWIHEPAGHPADVDTAGPMPGAPLAAPTAHRRGIRRIHRPSPRAVRRHRRPRPAGPTGDLRCYGGVRRGAQAPPRLKRSRSCWSRWSRRTTCRDRTDPREHDGQVLQLAEIVGRTVGVRARIEFRARGPHGSRRPRPRAAGNGGRPG